jgi:cytochrome P450
MRIIQSPDEFSSDIGLGRGMEGSLVVSDPPWHTKLRSVATPFFTPKAVAQLAPMITSMVQGLLDQVAERGQMDMIDDLAAPLPVMVIAEMLGVPHQDRPRFKEWSDTVVNYQIPSAEKHRLQKEMVEYFKTVFENHRRDPKDDFITVLLEARIDGEPLSDQSLLGFCILLLVAGNETTTTLIGNMMLCLDEFPETPSALRNDRSLIPGFIEEVVRYRSPIKTVGRRVMQPVTLQDQELQAGQILRCYVAAANLDEAQFPDPLRFDLHRTPNRHLGFGHGIHFCLGAPLARLEASIVLTEVLNRFPSIQRLKERPLEAIAFTSSVQGIKHFSISV